MNAIGRPRSRPRLGTGIPQAVEAGRRPTNEEMVQGFMDGYDLDAPEPSENRSRSYRHGFANGRADKTGKSRGPPVAELERLADEAMDADSDMRIDF